MKPLFLLIVLLFSPLAMADDVNLIASYCKKQWSGDKGLQSYCIKNQRNYKDWLDYIRKRVFSDDASRIVMKACVNKYKPDYQRAFNCYWK